MDEMEKDPQIFKRLAHLARRLQDNPNYMARVLTAYKKQERLDDYSLAVQLNVTESMLVRLALCKRPDSESSQFAAQVRQIAAYADVDAVQLANLLRQVESVEQLSKQPINRNEEGVVAQDAPLGSGLMAAARDREQAEKDQTSKDSSEMDDNATG